LIRYNPKRADKEGIMQRILCLAALGGCFATGNVWAQQQPVVPTTVQLPSFAFFSVNTTVSVPDSGGASLGGMNHARDASATRGFGPLRNRGLGGDRLASGVSVHATIIDHDELDRAVRGEAAMRGPVDPDIAKAEDLSRHVGREPPIAATSGRAGATAGSPGSALLEGSVAAIRAQNAAAAETRFSEAANYFAQAEQAEADGKPAVARIYYQMVARRDEGQLKQAAAARLAALAPKKVSTVAKR
jgi:hypothetical protein